MLTINLTHLTHEYTFTNKCEIEAKRKSATVNQF